MFLHTCGSFKRYLTCPNLSASTSISKQNNFARLGPTLLLLGIPFDVTSAQGLMQEKPGVATHLLYQLYISLEQKKTRMTKTSMDMKQPGAIAGLSRKDPDVSVGLV